MEDFMLTQYLTEDTRLSIQQSYARSLRLLKNKENKSKTLLNDEKQKNEELSHENQLLQKELDSNRTNSGNEIYSLQCQKEKLEKLLREKELAVNRLTNQIESLDDELITIKNLLPSQNLTPTNIPTQKRTLTIRSSKFNCSSFIYLPLHIYPSAPLLTSIDYTAVIDKILLHSPCILKSKGSFPITDINRPYLNPDSHPVISPSITSLPFYSLQWDDSRLTYLQFYETIILPIHTALTTLVNTSCNTSTTSYPLSQLLSFSLSSLECLLNHQQTIPSFHIDQSELGRLLLDNGIPRNMILFWQTNPKIQNQQLFEIFKHLNRSDSLQKAMELTSLNELQNQFKNSSFAALPALPNKAGLVTAASAASSPLKSSELMNKNEDNTSLVDIVKSLETQRDQLLQEIATLEFNLTNEKEDNRTLMKQLELAVCELNQIKENTASKSQEIQDLQRKYESQAGQISRLSNMVQEAEIQQKESEQMTEKLKQLYLELESSSKKETPILIDRSVNTDESLSSSPHPVDQQENEKENLIHSLESDLKVEKEKLTHEREQFQMKITELKKINQNQSNEVIQLKEVQDELTTQLQNKQNELTQLRNKDEMLANEIKDDEMKLNKLQENLLGMMTEHQQLDHSYHTLGPSLQRFDSEIIKYQDQIAALLQQKSQKLTSLTLSLQKILKNSSQNKKIQIQEREKLLQERDQLRALIQANSDQKSFTELSTELSSLQKEFKLLSQRNSNLETEHRRQIDTTIHLNQTIKSLNSLLQAKETEINDTLQHTHQQEEKYKELSIRYTSAQTEIELLRAALRKVNEDMSSLLKENNKYEYTTTELLKTTQQTEMSLQDLKGQMSANTLLLNKKESEIYELKTEKERLIKKITELTNERERDGGGGVGGGGSYTSPRDLSPGKWKKHEVGEDTSAQLMTEISVISPGKSSRSGRSSSISSAPGGGGPAVMSRSAPLPSIESDTSLTTNGPTTERSKERKPKKGQNPNQVYYKGVPIEELQHPPEAFNDLLDLESRPTASSSSSSTATTVHKKSSSTTLRPSFAASQPTDGSMIIGLDGMKGIRNINSQEYQRHTQSLLHTHHPSPASSSSVASFVLKPLINAPVIPPTTSESSVEPLRQSTDRLPALNRDLPGNGGGGGSNENNSHRILQKKSISSSSSTGDQENTHDKTIIPFGNQNFLKKSSSRSPTSAAAAASSAFSSSSSPPPPASSSAWTGSGGSSSLVSSSLDKDSSNGPQGTNRRTSNFRPSFVTSNSTEGKRKSIQEKNQMIQKIIAQSAEYRSKALSSSSFPSPSSSFELGNTEDQDEANDLTMPFKFQSSSSVTSSSNEEKKRRNQHSKLQSSSTSLSSASVSSSTAAPTGGGGGNKQGKGGRQNERSPSPLKKKKTSPSVDSLHHKIPCAICGMHFSGDGLKLPQYHPNSLLPSSSSSSSLSVSSASLHGDNFSSDHEILFCSFDCARLWGKTKPYQSHLHHQGLN